jgi:hypothetical protein
MRLARIAGMKTLCVAPEHLFISERPGRGDLATVAAADRRGYRPTTLQTDDITDRRRYRPTTLPNPLLAVPCVLLVPAVL